MKKIILNTLSILCMVAIGICTAFISEIAGGYKAENDFYNKVASASCNESGIDFKTLSRQNSDVIGWIKIPGTRIDYPIVKTDNNDKYLHTLFNGEPGNAGCIFADFRFEPFDSALTIIYGHRMKVGSMFSNLGRYRKASFAKKHRKIFLYTPSRTYDLEIVLFATIGADNSVYNNYFTSATAVYDMLKGYAHYTYEKPKPNEKLVMLSTCTYEFKNARYVLVGKLQ